MEATTFGSRLRQARKAAGLTQQELGTATDRSAGWIREVEHDRVTPDRHSLLVAMADACKVPLEWLLGQPYNSDSPELDAGQTSVPALRGALRRTSLILSGHPGMRPDTVLALTSKLRDDVDHLTRRRQAAKLPEVMLGLPSLAEQLNTSLLLTEAQELDVVYGLVVEMGHIARMVLNQLGQHDLAWTASDVAATAAARLGDPLMKACSAWDRCGVLLHTGSLAETITVAEAALADLEPLLGDPTPEALSLFGALNLRCAVASARRPDEPSAWQYLHVAEETAARLGENRNDYQTVFGPANVIVHASEIAVELGQPDKAMEFHANLNASDLPSNERRTRHGIDVARALTELGRDSQAVQALNSSISIAPHYVYNHPMARLTYEQLARRSQPSAVAMGLGEIARGMGKAQS